jgi:hypothetical protein
VVQDEFLIDHVQLVKRRRTAEEKRLVKQLWYQKRLRDHAEKEVALLKTNKLGGRLSNDTIVKVMLSDPVVNGRRLREIFVNDFVDGSSSVSHTYVVQIRDAFVETLKNMCSDHVQSLVSLARVAPRRNSSVVFATHVHDEASMRFRSYDRVIEEAFGNSCGTTFSRGRYSKVQNDFISVVVSRGDPVEWFSELLPLSKKDGVT